MKTKNLLYAMALPVLFGACAQDEFENVAQSTSNPLATEGVNIGPVAISVGEKPQTRLGQNTPGGAWNVWNGDDIIGAVQYSYYKKGSDTPEYVSSAWGSMMQQHPMTLEDGSLFRGHTDFFEGDYFVYYPLQTKWIGDENIQTNYGEFLQVYSPTIQEDNVDEHNKWVSENALQLSGTRAIKGDDAGLNKGVNFTLKQFSNYLSFVNKNGNGAPEIKNRPSDLVVYSYELRTFSHNEAADYGLSADEYGSAVVKPFATMAEINGEKMPKDDSFLYENGWSCGDITAKIKKGDFYNAKEFTNKIELEVKSNSGDYVTEQNARSFTFTLLPVAEIDMVAGQIGTDVQIQDRDQGRIYLVAYTNYGVILQDVVYVSDDKLGQGVNGYDQETTLSEIYWGDELYASSKFEGLMNVAGRNIICAVEFDFLNVVHNYPGEVCNNQSLNEAITWINNLKEKLGDSYTQQTLQLCENPTFKNLDIPAYLEKKVADGVEVKFRQADGGSAVTFLGDCTLADNTLLDSWVGNNTKYIVGNDKAPGTLTVPAGSDIARTIYVAEKGELHNNGTIAAVQVYSNNGNYNNGTIKQATVHEGGRLANGGADLENGRQTVIEELNNEGYVSNYATIKKVASNSGIIVLEKTNSNGNQFAIGNVEDYDNMTGSIEYTVNANEALTDDNMRHTESGVDMMKALDNKATRVTINADVVDVRDYADKHIYANSELVIAQNSMLALNGYVPSNIDAMLKVSKVTVNEGVKLTVYNWNAEMSDYNGTYYAISAKEFSLNSNSTLYVKDKTIVRAWTLDFNGGDNITISGDNKETSRIYSKNFNLSGVTVENNVTINKIAE